MLSPSQDLRENNALARATTPYKRFPRIVLSTIAEYLNPFQLLNLACVSREWYQVFTSDTVWRDWDVNSIESGIYSHYLRCKPDFTSEQEWEYQLDEFDYSSELNWYTFLHVCRSSEERLYGDRRLQEWRKSRIPNSVVLAISKRPIQARGGLFFDQFHETVLRKKELVYALLSRGVGLLGLPTSYKSDPVALFRILEAPSWKLYESGLQTFVMRDEVEAVVSFFDAPLVETVKFALRALENCVMYYAVFTPELQGNLQVVDRLFEMCEKFSTNVLVNEHWDFPASVLADTNRLTKMLQVVRPGDIYARMCNTGAVSPNVTALLAASAALPSCAMDIHLLDPCRQTLAIRKSLLQDRDFVLTLLANCPGLPEWSDIPSSLRSDPVVLKAIAANLVRDQRPFPYRFYLSEGLPVISRIISLVKCEHPIDIGSDMETLLKILSLPEERLKDCLTDGHQEDKEYFEIEDLAKFLFSAIGQAYGEGPVTKRRCA